MYVVFYFPGPSELELKKRNKVEIAEKEKKGRDENKTKQPP